MRKTLILLTWWWVWSLTGESFLEKPRWEGSFKSVEECVQVAKAMQGGGLIPYYYCRSSPIEHPGILPQRHEVEIKGLVFPPRAFRQE